MGIPDFVSWLKTLSRNPANKIPRFIFNRPPRNISSLSIDANALFHEVAQVVYGYGRTNDLADQFARIKMVGRMSRDKLEAEYINSIINQLQLTVENYGPRDVLIIAVDGVVPMAKIIQQRKRRYAAMLSDPPEHLKGKWHSNWLTPGTEIMLKIDSAIQNWISSSRATLPPTVIYSSHLAPGEGEHKITELYRKGTVDPNKTHVLLGADADLIMLALLSSLKQIWVSRSMFDNIKISVLKNWLMEYMNTISMNDFIVMSFLIGNDFLPQIAATSTLNDFYTLLFKVYVEVKVKMAGVIAKADFLVQKIKGVEQVDLTNLGLFLEVLARYETSLMENKIRWQVERKIQPSEISIKAVETGRGRLDLNTFRQLWYNRMFYPAKTGLKELVRQSCLEYLKSFNWILTYYLYGADNINLYSYYPYHYAPLLLDLAIISKQVPVISGFLTQSGQEWYTPMHQLLAVIPPQMRDFLPKEIQNLTKSNSPIGDMFPYSVAMVDDGVDKEYKRTVLINFVSMERIIEAVEDLTEFSAMRLRELASVSNRYYIDQARKDALLAEEREMREQQKRNLGQIDFRALDFYPRQDTPGDRTILPPSASSITTTSSTYSRPRDYSSRTTGTETKRYNERKGTRERRDYGTREPRERRDYGTREPRERRDYGTREPRERRDYGTREPRERRDYGTREPRERRDYGRRRDYGWREVGERRESEEIAAPSESMLEPGEIREYSEGGLPMIDEFGREKREPTVISPVKTLVSEPVELSSPSEAMLEPEDFNIEELEGLEMASPTN